MKILHSLDTWLNPTENWIYDQISSVKLEQDVICTNLLPNNNNILPGSRIFVRKDYNLLETIKVKLNNRFNVTTSIKDDFKKYSDYNILFSHFANHAWKDLLYTQKFSLKRIVRFYGIDLDFTFRKRYWAERYKTIFEEYDAVITEGSAMKEKIQSFGCPAEKIAAIHHGIIPNMQKPSRDFSNINKVIKCLICGRFAEKKGFRYAVKALGELKKNFNIAIDLTIIGDAARDNDFLEKEEMLKFIKHYQLNAKFLGMVSMEVIKDQMKNNDIFLSPSVTPENGDIEGGFPTTLIHAAEAGMILIGTTHCDIPEIIHHGKNGYLSPERDISSLVKNLNLITTSSQQNLIDMSLYGYNLIKTDFNLNEQSKKLESLYRKTMAS